MSRKHKRVRAVRLRRPSRSYSARRRHFRIRVAPGWRAVRLHARARDGSGRVKVRTRTIRLRHAR